MFEDIQRHRARFARVHVPGVFARPAERLALDALDAFAIDVARFPKGKLALGKIVADTMDLWIETTRADLDALLPRVDLLILNDSEARELTKETSLIKAGRRIRKSGPKYVAIKKGEHGALLFGEDDFFSCGAYPLEDIHDPTGAGDTFAGGMAGYLASADRTPTFADLRRAVIYGSVLASFNVEAFSLERLRTLTMDEIRGRYEMFKAMSAFEELGRPQG